MWRPKYSERKRQEATWILTSCILLHSSVGLLQGVGCGGALCCKKAREQRSVMLTQTSPCPHSAQRDTTVAVLPS